MVDALMGRVGLHARSRRGPRTTSGGSLARSAAPSSGRSSRRTATGTARRTSAPAALEAGATALCVTHRRRGAGAATALPDARILVLGPRAAEVCRGARRRPRARRLRRARPRGCPVHLKLDTGMGRWGLSELPAPGSRRRRADDPLRRRRRRPGLHASCSSSDSSRRPRRIRSLTRHAANSAAALALPTPISTRRAAASRSTASHPSVTSRHAWALRPALRWESEVAGARRSARGRAPATGVGSSRPTPTWIALVPVGYADGFRRDMTGTEVLVAGERCPVVGTVSMDVIAVETPGPVESRGARDAAGRRDPDRAARADRGHDRVRDRVRPEHASATGGAAGGRWLTRSRFASRSSATGPPTSTRAWRGCCRRSTARSARSTRVAARARSPTRSPPGSRRVVGVDTDERYLAAARASCPENCTFVTGDAGALPFGYGEFDLAGCLRVLHHVRRPELVVAELARVTRPGGVVLVVDQLGAIDPTVSIELDRFERARDPSHQRLLPDADVRGFLDANDLVVLANEVVRERRDMEHYLDLAGLEGDERDADPPPGAARRAGGRDRLVRGAQARRVTLPASRTRPES